VSQSVADGYKQGSSFDADKGMFNATYICNDADSPNYGHGLSAYAPTWYDAMRLLAYKHEVVFDRLWVGDGKESARSKWG
jgi:hypothetical protein